MFHQYTIKEALQNFDSGSIRRGIAYYNKGKVRDIIWESNTTFSAEVFGSYIYFQKIVIYPNNSMEGTCTCPVGVNCKHVVAAIYGYVHSDIPLMHEPKIVKPLNQSELWLNKLLEANKSKQTKNIKIPQYGEDFIIYKLFEDKYNDGSHLEFCRTRILKKGQTKTSLLPPPITQARECKISRRISQT